MAELNIVDTGAGGAQGQIVTPYLQTLVPGYSYGMGNGYLEFGSGTPGSLPFRVDQAGNVTGASFTGVTVNSVEWFSVLAFGADRTGTADSSAAFQATLNAIAAAGGGVMYIPFGNYLIGTGLTWSSAHSLTVIGDGPGASNIRCNNGSASITYLSVTNSARFTMRDVSFLNNVNSPAFSDTNINVGLTSVTWGALYNVTMQTGVATNRVNQGVVISNCTNIDFVNCDIRAYVNSVYVTGNSQVITFRGGQLGGNSGSGVSSSALLLADSTVQTIQLDQTTLSGGDRGLLWQGGSGANPAFLVMQNVGINNPVICAMDIETGAEVWLDQVWSSVLSATGTEHGLIFGSSFEGNAYLSNCTFQGWSGHSVFIEGGSGYTFRDCVFGAGVKATANTFDEINIGASTDYVTIAGCHFNTDPFYGVGSTKARSAVFVTAGAAEVSVIGNVAASAASYGTAGLVDQTGNVVRKGNIGLGLAETSTGTGGPVTGVAFAALTPTVTAPALDAVPGTVYKISALGTGIQATGSAVNLTARYTFGGGVGSFTPGTNPGAGVTFTWQYEGYLQILTTGASGTANLVDKFTWGPVTAPVTTYHSNFGVAVNTTTANTLGLFAEWASTTGSPTITCDVCVIERVANMPAS